jgi:beta-glucosidase/6-phospho-beta-glucosidase/beta-galactosidase
MLRMEPHFSAKPRKACRTQGSCSTSARGTSACGRIDDSFRMSCDSCHDAEGEPAPVLLSGSADSCRRRCGRMSYGYRPSSFALAEGGFSRRTALISRRIRMGRRNVGISNRGCGQSRRPRPLHLPHVCDRAGTIADGSSGAVACDHYHRWESDLDLMRSLGIRSYRFSIAWPRVLPEGRGSVNRRGPDFYDRLIDGLLAREISPVVTLYHWDLPQALQDRGGWENRDSADWFADYAMVVFTRLGDRVDHWLTINEAKVIAEQGYRYGRMAPGKTDLRAAGTVIHHLNLAHGRAVTAFRAAKAKGRIGPCLQLAPCYPADQSEQAAAAVQAADLTENTLYLDPLLKGRYPDLSQLDGKLATGLRAAVKQGDLANVSAPVDFLGVNYYSPVVVDSQGQALQPHPASAAGWQQIYPRGLYDTLTRIRREYGAPEVMITENGVPDDARTAVGQPSTIPGSSSWSSISGRCIRPLQTAAASPGTTSGLSWTTLSGPPGTPSGGALSKSTSTPCNAPRRAPPPGTPPSQRTTKSPRSSSQQLAIC